MRLSEKAGDFWVSHLTETRCSLSRMVCFETKSGHWRCVECVAVRRGKTCILKPQRFQCLKETIANPATSTNTYPNFILLPRPISRRKRNLASEIRMSAAPRSHAQEIGESDLGIRPCGADVCRSRPGPPLATARRPSRIWTWHRHSSSRAARWRCAGNADERGAP